MYLLYEHLTVLITSQSQIQKKQKMTLEFDHKRKEKGGEEEYNRSGIDTQKERKEEVEGKRTKIDKPREKKEVENRKM